LKFTKDPREWQDLGVAWAIDIERLAMIVRNPSTKTLMIGLPFVRVAVTHGVYTQQKSLVLRVGQWPGAVTETCSGRVDDCRAFSIRAAITAGSGGQGGSAVTAFGVCLGWSLSIRPLCQRRDTIVGF